MSAATEVSTALPAELGQATINPEQYAAAVIAPFQSALAKAISEDVTDYDVTTTAGMKVATARRAVFRDIRVAAEKERTARKAPLLEIGRLLDAKAKDLTAQAKPHEDRHDSLIKSEEARKAAEKAEKERIERERISAIHERIGTINGVPATVIGKASEVMQQALDDLQAVVIDLQGFGEFAGIAMQARNKAAEQLGQMIGAMRSHEQEQARIKADREELARQQAEQRRIDAEAKAQREAEEKARQERIAAEDAARRKQEETDRAARAEADRVAAEAHEAEQRRLNEQAAELRRRQEEFAAQQRAAEEAAKAIAEQQPAAEAPELAPEPDPGPVFTLVEPPASAARPADAEILDAVAGAFGVAAETAHDWLTQYASNHKQAAA